MGHWKDLVFRWYLHNFILYYQKIVMHPHHPSTVGFNFHSVQLCKFHYEKYFGTISVHKWVIGRIWYSDDTCVILFCIVNRSWIRDAFLLSKHSGFHNVQLSIFWRRHTQYCLGYGSEVINWSVMWLALITKKNGKVFIKSPSVPDDELNFMKYTTVKRIPLLLRKLEILIVIQPKSSSGKRSK